MTAGPARPLGLALAAMVFLACDDAGETGCGLLDDDPRLVQNSGPGVWEVEGRSPALRPLWRRGGTIEGEVLSFPAGIATSPEGRAAIPDFELAELIVIDANGNWRGAWAGRGPGPGELDGPVAAAWAGSDTVVVLDVGASELEFITARGGRGEALAPEFAGPAVALGRIDWAAVDGLGTSYLKSASAFTDGGAAEWQSIVRLARGGTPDTLLTATVPLVPSSRRGPPQPGHAVPLAAVGGGRLYLSDPAGRYLITVLGGEEEPVRRVCRDVASIPLSQGERGRGPAPEGREELAAAISRGPRPSVPAAFGRLLASADGHLWVQRERPDPRDSDAAFFGAAGAPHDVFDPRGRYLGTVPLPEGFRLQAIRGDTVWGFRRGDLDEVWVEAYELGFESPGHGLAP